VGGHTRLVVVGALCAIVSFVVACRSQSPTLSALPKRTRIPTATPSSVPTITPSALPTAEPTRRPTPAGLPAAPEPGDSWVRGSDDMLMLYVPQGTYLMGTDPNDLQVQDDEVPAHAVTLAGFWIDQSEVTNEQYARCVDAGVCQPPFKPVFERHERYFTDSDKAQYPVIYVSWLQSKEYCDWVGGRLPSEAQWEYAARGPENHVYPWGGNSPTVNLLNHDRQMNDPAAVGSYPAGASWIGALDMAGNVYEWTADWYGRYPSEPQQNPDGPEKGIGHVLRGGSWFDGDDFVRAANRYAIREAYRDYTAPTGYGFNIGFRCVLNP
jgi:formylglycine-generating enzyme required for sulfatase activity